MGGGRGEGGRGDGGIEEGSANERAAADDVITYHTQSITGLVLLLQRAYKRQGWRPCGYHSRRQGRQ